MENHIRNEIEDEMESGFRKEYKYDFPNLGVLFLGGEGSV